MKSSPTQTDAIGNLLPWGEARAFEAMAKTKNVRKEDER
jgi:hypothetical protein